LPGLSPDPPEICDPIDGKEEDFGILHSNWNGNDWSPKKGFNNLYLMMRSIPEKEVKNDGNNQEI